CLYSHSVSSFIIYFFFQAEDGIRDRNVTGVQTCALPISPVLNYPEAVILGIGRIAEKPVVRNGEIVVAPVLALSLSFDHRIVDGATGQEALNQIKRLLNDPQLIMM